jgi:hypothetical protein
MTDPELLSMLLHEATISRFTPDAGQDDHGNAESSYVPDAGPVPGFWQPIAEKRIRVGGDWVVATSMCVLESSVVVTTQDRLIINGRAFDVLQKLEEQEPGETHHLELLLSEVQG